MYQPTTRVLAVLELLQSRPGINGATLDRAEALFKRVNDLLAG